MGVLKRMMMERECNLAVATDFLVSIGTLQVCEHHEIAYEGDGNLDRVWPIAMAERRRGSNGRVPWAAGMKSCEFTDLLKDSYENHRADSCYACDKWERE